MVHYHVRRHTDDDDPMITDDLFAALGYARDELDHLADMEHEAVSFTAEEVVKGYNGIMSENSVSKYDMELALLSFAKVETYSNIMLNASNMVKQHNAAIAERAPFYTPDWEEGGEDAAQARLFESAKRIAAMVNNDTPLSIGECSADLLTWPDEDQMHGGESYCADEYPDGYAGYQDGPCGDH